MIKLLFTECFGFCVTSFVFREKVSYEIVAFDSTHNITKDNYLAFHDDEFFEKTILIEKNKIMNLMDNKVNLRRFYADRTIGR